MESIQQLRSQFQQELLSISTLTQHEEISIKYLGRSGSINTLLKTIKDVPLEQKKEFGATVNGLKKEIEHALEEKKQQVLSQTEDAQYTDVTLPGTPYARGSVHLVTIAIEEISRVFSKLGFNRMSYPEIEWEQYSFENLNMPPEHPARDDFETFFVDHQPSDVFGKMILSPHTSSGQTREMQRVQKPPIRMINLAKCYRPNWDASHVPMFHQFEGLCVDTGITISHLKGTIDYFAKEFFGANRKTRIRPFHFQFTEPSFEVDVSCGVCDGTGIIDGTKCKICKSGWLELGGAGMVHPNVLKAGGIDSDVYSGWAFGFGIERTFMMKEGLNLDDIRVLYSGDVRFLEQF
ncbi:phenylalanine--tRNA ligase subunit alpha [Candidatus Roizmanbacteria bacterium]|nr:phenylalanine--tRNA ligase subunit alpha [Candidatus Roizmanbacteria bacterium]